jgi:Polysaccharide deacetylase
MGRVDSLGNESTPERARASANKAVSRRPVRRTSGTFRTVLSFLNPQGNTEHPSRRFLRTTATVATLLVTTSGLLVWALLADPQVVPRGVPVAVGSLALVSMFTARFLIRSLRRRPCASRENEQFGTLFGADDAGRLQSRGMGDRRIRFFPAELLDDDKARQHSRIDGVRLRGTGKDIDDVAQRSDATAPIEAPPLADAGLAPFVERRRHPRIGRMSAMMGLLASGFVIANVARPSAAVADTPPTYVPTWAPSTAYAFGQQVISPSNDVVAANVAHTSSAAYVIDTAKWTLSSSYGLAGVAPVARWRKPLDGATFVTQFQPPHGWILTAGTGSAADDATAPSPFGLSSVKLVNAVSGTPSQAELWPVLGTALDLSGGNRLTVTLRFTNPSGGAGFAIYAGDASMANYYLWSPGVTTVANGWQTFEFSVANATAVGSPNAATTVTHLKFRALSGSTGGGVTHLAAVAVRSSTLYPNGVWTLSFDDTSVTHSTIAAPILGKYGMAAEACIIADVVGTNPSVYMSEDQIRALYDESGWDIAGHCYYLADHDAGGLGFTALTDTQLATDYTLMRKWLLDRGYPSSTWAAPHSNINDAVWVVCRKFFATARSTGSSVPSAGALQSAPALRPQTLYAEAWASGQLANTKAAMDRAKATHSWLVINFHVVQAADPGAGSLTIMTSDLDSLCAYAQSIGMAVKTTTQVMDETNRAVAI